MNAMRRMCLAMAAGIAMIGSALAGEIELGAIAAFGQFCIQTTDPSADVPMAMKEAGFTEVEGPLSKKMLAPQTGRAWRGNRAGLPLVVMLTDRGGCGVTSLEADPAEVRRLLESLPAILKLDEMQALATKSAFYATEVQKTGGRTRNLILLLRWSAQEGSKGIEMMAAEKPI